MDRKDFIYFLHDPLTQTVKIGTSQDPEKRVKDIQAGLPQTLTPIRYVEVSPDTGFQTETWLHLKFEAYRVRGEWFKAVPEVWAFAQSGDIPAAVAAIQAPVMAAPPPGMSLLSLARQVGVSARTIRYYIAEGLLPGPVSLGVKAAYTEEHLFRLRYIQKLQQEGCALADVQAYLNPDPRPQPHVPLPTPERWLVFQPYPFLRLCIQEKVLRTNQTNLEEAFRVFAQAVLEVPGNPSTEQVFGGVAKSETGETK